MCPPALDRCLMIYLLGGIRAWELKGGAEGRVPIVTLWTATTGWA